MDHTPSVSALLQKAWQFRFLQKLEQCRGCAVELKFRAGWKNSSQLRRIRSPKLNLAENIELVVLLASLARADQDLPLSEKLLNTARRWMEEGGLAPPFCLSFQSGLNYFQTGDFTSALDEFVSARRQANTLFERTCATANILFCLDNLGLPFESCVQELRVNLNQLRSEPAAEALETQFDCFLLRQAYREGSFDGFCRLRAIGTQSHYLQIWVSELPYTSLYRRYRDQISDLALSEHCLFHKSYRFRTLQGVIHPEDLTDFCLKEFADRLYLWTWRWLANPDEMPSAQIIRLLESANLELRFIHLSSESYQLIRNALGWLGLFHPLQAQPLQAWIERLKPGRLTLYPLYEFERRLIHYCKAKCSGRTDQAKESKDELLSHPLFRSSTTYWPILLKAICPHPELARVQSLIGTSMNAGKPLLVNFQTSTLEIQSRKIISETMCRALLLLREHPIVPADLFLDRCFGIGKYEPIVHNSKIYNLLARLRKVFVAGNLVFTLGMKESRVIAQGSWEKIHFQGNPDSLSPAFLFRRPSVDPPLETFNFSASRSRRLLLKNQLAHREFFRRSDIQRLAKVSKSAAHRMIQRWMKEGWIRSQGRARNLRYQWESSHSLRPNN